MITRYFVDVDGAYLGAFAVADFEIPPDAIQVPDPPPVNASQRWNGTGWDPAPPPPGGQN